MPNFDNGTLMQVFTDEVRNKAEEFMDKFRSRVGNMTLADLLTEFFFFMSAREPGVGVGSAPSGGPSEVKTMEVEEFMSIGLLQELNRQFLHPRGLAIEVRVEEGRNGEEFYSFGRIWDYRSDPVGIVFGDEVVNSPGFMEKFERVKQMFLDKQDVRIKSFGWSIQPVRVRGESDPQE
jgi:hypothetical protein